MSISHFAAPLGSLLRRAAPVGALAAMAFTLSAAAAVPSTMPAKAATPSPLIAGMWVWEPNYVSDLGEQDQLLAFCGRQGLNRLLVQVPWKKGTAQVVHPKTDDEAQAGTALHPEIDHPVELARLIAEAAKRNILIEALDGAPYMGDKAHWAESLATVDALLAFNQTLPAGARFVGVHWDIEPYVRPDWKDAAGRLKIEADTLQMLSDAKRKLVDAGSPMTLSLDIPMWYDNLTAPDDNCFVTFNGQRKNFQEHIQDVVDYVGIMSYRQKATGVNSSAEMSANEMAYAASIGKVVCPAFETVELDDTPKITFFGHPARRRFRPSGGSMMTDAMPAPPGLRRALTASLHVATRRVARAVLPNRRRRRSEVPAPLPVRLSMKMPDIARGARGPPSPGRRRDGRNGSDPLAGRD